MENEKLLIDLEQARNSVMDVLKGKVTTVTAVLVSTAMRGAIVDAVEVVRCKDCKHWNKDKLSCDTLPHESSYEHANWYEDDFCSYGERKGNE